MPFCPSSSQAPLHYVVINWIYIHFHIIIIILSFITDLCMYVYNYLNICLGRFCRVYVCLCPCLPVWMFVCLRVPLSVCLSVCLSVFPSVSMSVSVSLSALLNVRLSQCPTMSVCLSVLLSLWSTLSVCLSVLLYLWSTLNVCLSVCIYVRLCQSVCPSKCPSVHFECLSFRLSLCPTLSVPRLYCQLISKINRKDTSKRRKGGWGMNKRIKTNISAHICKSGGAK